MFSAGMKLTNNMAKFWGKLFLINFAMGVVTGIVLEFQFGMNWSVYARFVGDIFGAPLAMEALTSFFMESVFLGIWVFGWDRISKGLHLARHLAGSNWFEPFSAVDLARQRIYAASGWIRDQ